MFPNASNAFALCFCPVYYVMFNVTMQQETGNGRMQHGGQ